MNIGNPSGTALAILQARMTSTRLPGKSLTPIAGKPMLDYCIAGLRRSRRIGTVVVATSEQTADDPIVEAALRLGVESHRGSVHDVLDRFRGAAERFEGDPIVRLTADCPLMDGAVIDRVIARLLEGGFDYVSTGASKTFPRGLDVEAFTRAAFERAVAESTEPYQHEHVTPYLYELPGRFKLDAVSHDEDLSSWRLTVDTPEDLRVIRSVIEGLLEQGEPIEFSAVVRFVKRHLEILDVNRHVRQKSFKEVE